MARIGRHRYRTVREYLLRQYGDFNAFQLMRLLLSDSDHNLPIERRLRFRADLSAAFPIREFTQLKLPPPVRSDPNEVGDTRAGEAPVEIRTANFCLASVTGPLPEPFTEWVRELSAERETAMADFFDMFNQRANVVRYRFKQALTPGLDDTAPAETEIAHCLASLMGLANTKLAAQVPLPARGWLGIAGLLANRRRQASTIVDVLSVALGAQVSLTEHVGAWLDIDERDRCSLGRRNHRLGQTCVVGHRVWDQHARLRLDIHTVDYDALRRLLPPAPRQPSAQNAEAVAAAVPAGQSDYAMLSGLVKLLVDRLADCEIVLHVRDDSITRTPLPQPARRDDTTSMRLGQSAWLAGRPAQPRATRPVRYVISTYHTEGTA
jgi:type VI secretion system protein ImpH